MGFSAQLRESTAATWDAAVGHRFVEELWSGALDRGVLRHYLEQDLQFVDSFLALLGAAVATADRPGPRVRLARQLGLVAGPENDYFERSLGELDGNAEPERAAPTVGFVDLMGEARDAGYAETLAVLVVAEWLYLDWATRPGATTPTTGSPASGSSCTAVSSSRSGSRSCATSSTVPPTGSTPPTASGSRRCSCARSTWNWRSSTPPTPAERGRRPSRSAPWRRRRRRRRRSPR
ncbi:TenA family protein [Pseudonocardia sp. ICBG601]|uniref:TenA family protein n=1 Tax=Pseudonocardia sp. ICBG601 TaxID=2846759 RepID=UPI001CF6DF41|nr:TenA family protein [Pseudonocardia sp. ICBG601]